MAQIDPLAGYQKTATNSADWHFPITPNDDEDLPIKPRGLFVAAGGNVVLRDEGGQDLTYPVETGAMLLFRPVRVLASGTTATVYGWA